MLFMLCEWSDKTFGDKNDTEYIKLWKDKVGRNGRQSDMKR